MNRLSYLDSLEAMKTHVVECPDGARMDQLIQVMNHTAEILWHCPCGWSLGWGK